MLDDVYDDNLAICSAHNKHKTSMNHHYDEIKGQVSNRSEAFSYLPNYIV